MLTMYRLCVVFSVLLLSNLTRAAIDPVLLEQPVLNGWQNTQFLGAGGSLGYAKGTLRTFHDNPVLDPNDATGYASGHMTVTDDNDYYAAHQTEFIGDFNGDKRADFLYYDETAGTGTSAWRTLLTTDQVWDDQPLQNGVGRSNGGAGGVFGHRQPGHLTGDFDGDNKTDLMYWFDQSAPSRWVMLLSSNNWVPSDWADGNHRTFNHFWSSHENVRQRMYFTGDFNGDDKTDFMYYNGEHPTDSSGAWQVLRGTTTGSADVENLTLSSSVPMWNAYTPAKDYVQPLQFVGDLNGDGNDDFMFWGGITAKWQVLLRSADGTHWASRSSWGGGIWKDIAAGNVDHQSQPFHFTGDFNGDGKTDFMYWHEDPTNSSEEGWHVLLSTGSTFDAQFWGKGNSIGHWSNHLGTTKKIHHHTGDFNGDGKTDFMYWDTSADTTGWRVLFSTGSGWQDVYIGPALGGGGYVGDFTGNGRDDLLQWDTNPPVGEAPGWRVLSVPYNPQNNLFPHFVFTRAVDSYALSWRDVYSSNDYHLFEGLVILDEQGRETWVDWQHVQQGGSSYDTMGKARGFYRYKLMKYSFVQVPGTLIATHQTSSAFAVHQLGAPSISGPATSVTGSYILGVQTEYVADSNIIFSVLKHGNWAVIPPTFFNMVTGEHEWVFTDKASGLYQYKAEAHYEECEPDTINQAIIDAIFGGSEECENLRADKTVAVTVVSPSLVFDGSELTWNSTEGVTHYVLQQQQANGSWTTVYSGYETTFAGLSAGSRYRVQACESSNLLTCGDYSQSWDYLLAGAQPAPSPVEKPAITDYGDDTVGSLEGEFRVSEVGAATYKVPIMTAAGTAGVVPEISLNYSSQAGKGIAGKGWSISGASAITRCRQTLQIDGVAKSISWSDDDRFCLDGQRLLVDDGQIYGAVGASYRTEIDSFAEVESVGGSEGHPDYFVVTRKDGSTSYYGYNNSVSHSKQDVGYGNILTWAISEFRDSVGNPIKFEYHNDADGFALLRLYYAFGDNKADNTSNTYIEFEYSTDRSDPINGYQTGYLVGNRLLLNSIASYSNHTGTGVLLREYNLSYAAQPVSSSAKDNLTNYLVGIEECEALGQCYPATTFDWGQAVNFGDAIGLPTRSIENLDHPYLNHGVLDYKFADINGDGKQDVVWLNQYIDNDGNSADQILSYALATDAGFTSPMMFATGSSSGTDLIFEPCSVLQGANNGPRCYRYENNFAIGERLKLQIIDYNADGRQDILVHDNRGGDHWDLFLSTPESSNQWRLKKTDVVLPFHNKDMFFGDINSDGLLDAMNISDDGASLNSYILTKNNNVGSGSALNYHYIREPDLLILYPNYYNRSATVEFPSGTAPQIGDFNGDGNNEVVLIIKAFKAPRCFVGDHFCITYHPVVFEFTETYLAPFETNYSIPKFDYDGPRTFEYSLSLSDINQDGNVDILYGSLFQDPQSGCASEGKQYVVFGRGEKASIPGEIERQVTLSECYPDDYHRQSAADLNHDGYPDLYWRENVVLKARYWQPSLRKFGAVEVLASVSGDDKINYSIGEMDGKPGLELIDASGEYDRIHIYSYDQFPDGHNNIDHITNGLGAQTHIDYEALTNTDNYARVEGIAGSAQVDLRCSPIFLGLESCVVIDANPADSSLFYQRLNDPFYDLPTGAATIHPENASPILEMLSPMQVVTHVESAAPLATAIAGQVDQSAMSSIGYFYHEAKLQAAGRGFLGFKKVTTVDEQTGVTTTTQYRQDFPFIGYPLITETRLMKDSNGVGGELLSRSENTWGLKSFDQGDFKDNTFDGVSGPPNPTNPSDHLWLTAVQSEMASKSNGYALLGSLKPYVANTVQKTYHSQTTADTVNYPDGLVVSGNVLKTVVNTNDYDIYGNVMNNTIESYTGDAIGGILLKTQNTVNHYDATNGWDAEEAQRFGRLSSTTVTHDRSGTASGIALRTSSFTYYPLSQGGLLETEILEPGDPLLELTTTYLYDTFGNKERVTQQAADASNGAATADINGVTIGADTNDRYSRWEYDALGRYVERTYNSKNQLVESVLARNSYGAPTQVANIDGVITETDYTPFGKPFLSYSPNGGWTHTTYLTCSYGCPTGAAYGVTTRQSGGGQSTEYFDVLARAMQQEAIGFDGDVITTQIEYDNIGRAVRQSTPYYNVADRYWTETAYDILGRPIAIHPPQAAQQTVSYNGFITTTTVTAANQSAVIGGNTEVTISQTNALGELVLVTDALNGTVSYSYDAQGNLQTTTTTAGDDGVANGDVPTAITITLNYDLLGRKISMSDPDKGDWSYDYNGFGELISQTDANGNVTTMSYDALGRQVRREDWRDIDSNPTTPNDTQLEGNTTWVYDTTRVGMGKLDNVQDSVSGYQQNYDYDSLGRQHAMTTITGTANNDATYSTATTWDEYGRVFQQFDATGNDQGTQYSYNANGYLDTVREAKITNGVQPRYFSVEAMTARGQVSQVRWGNEAISTRQFNAARGTPEQLVTTLALHTVQDLTVDFDDFGNLVSRHNQGLGIGANSTNSSPAKQVLETLSYDALNRLRNTSFNNSTASQSVTYDSFGNIKTKSGVGTYTYGEPESCGSVTGVDAGPHAVTSVVRSSDNVTEYYCYDRNGNMIADTTENGGRTLLYSSFDKPTQITKGNHQIDFSYGPNRSRYKRIDTNSGDGTLDKTTLYMGNVERITHAAGTVEYKRYLEGQILVTDTYYNAWADTYSSETQYLIKDYLGSTELVLNHDATQGLDTVYVAEDMSFDAWGQRRQSADGAPMGILALLSFDHSTTTQGFTGHEMLDAVGLIHMNGRVYDPRLGRFMQADPFIQASGNTQSYNRYAYVMNNPLVGTDPSGYFGAFDAIKIVITVVLSIYCQPCAVAFAGLTTAAQVAAAGGSFRDALRAGVSAAVLTYAGGKFGADGLFAPSEIVAFGLLGGVTTALQGGKFGHGFVSAAIGGALGGAGPSGGGWGIVIRAGTSAVVGGTVSKVTGGKFANGAATAAFASLVASAANSGRLNERGGTTPKQISDNVKTNPALKDNITVTDVGGNGLGSEFDFVDWGDTSGSLTRIDIQGSIANASDGKATFNKTMRSIRRLNNTVAANDSHIYDLTVDVNVVADVANADWVVTVGGSGSFAFPGRSGAAYPINIATGGGFANTGAHEFLHTLGLYHQANSTSALTSYDVNSATGRDYRSLSFSEADRLASGYR